MNFEPGLTWRPIRLLFILCLLPVALAGCRAAGQEPTAAPPPTAEEAGDQPDGAVERISDRVEVGPADGQLQPVTDRTPFRDGDAVGVRDGGEGLLDFGLQMQLRLFNDTELHVVAAETVPGSPLDVRMFLVEGGFTGELLEEGGRAVFETPDGADIVILGTEFWVAYNPQEQTTYVGNFGGTVQVEVGSEQLSVPSGSAMVLPARNLYTLTVNKEQFEQLARESRSPLAAAVTTLPTPTPLPSATPTSTPPTRTPTATAQSRQPDLQIPLVELTGDPYFNKQGQIAIPVAVTVANTGRLPADLFKLSATAETREGTYLFPFTVPGQRSLWYPFTSEPLYGGDRVTIGGEVLLREDYSGQQVRLVVLADSCASEEFVEPYCRIMESDEENNSSQPLAVKLP